MNGHKANAFGFLYKRRRHPRLPSQQVSQIRWHREHWNLARISIRLPPQTGQAAWQWVSDVLPLVFVFVFAFESHSLAMFRFSTLICIVFVSKWGWLSFGMSLGFG
jgi:hypothetical protein